jgi:hypothetical protein
MSWKTTFWLVGLWGLTAQGVCVNGHPSIASEFQHSKAVVLATVIGIKQLPETQDGNFLDGIMYQVKVQRRFKGSNPPTLDVFSENSSGRFEMTAGEAYLLFLYEDHGRLSVDNCGHSGVASKSTSAIEQITKMAHPKNL